SSSWWWGSQVGPLERGERVGVRLPVPQDPDRPLAGRLVGRVGVAGEFGGHGPHVRVGRAGLGRGEALLLEDVGQLDCGDATGRQAALRRSAGAMWARWRWKARMTSRRLWRRLAQPRQEQTAT